VIITNGAVPLKDLQKNLFFLADRKLEFIHSEDVEIWEYILDYARAYSSNPSITSLRDFFERSKKLEVLDRLNEIEALTNVYVNTDFENLVRNALKEQNERKASYLLKDAGHILTNSLEVKKGRKKEVYRGYQDAIRYIMERSDELVMSESGQKFRTDITEDAEEVLSEFQNRVANSSKAWGRGTGLQDIDTVCRGAKPGEMWVHAASTGEMKTSFALNWAYKTVFYFKYNVYYLSLEMPVEQVRLILYVMHSNHVKFKKMGYSQPLDYRTIRDGVSEDGTPISTKDKEFFEVVVKDIEKGEGREYGRLIVECPSEVRTTMSYVKQRVELKHQTTPIHLVFIDYLSLLSSDKKASDRREELNSLFREAKQFCLTFNKGERIPVVVLHQINRDGKKEADKNDGVYTASALADTSEAERNADVISYTYLNPQLRETSEVLIGCIKNRDNPPFKGFLARVHFPSRYIDNLSKQSGKIGLENLF
jgi:replicative DNA helicase